MEDLEGIEDWLYEDGEDGGSDAELSVYQKKRSDMESRVRAIFLRLIELEARPKAVEAARAVIASAAEVMALWPSERPQLSEEDISEVQDVIDSITAWLDEKEAAQKELETTDTPAFTSKEVSNKMARLKNLVARLLKKKRPAPVDPEKEKKEKEAAAAAEEEAEDGEQEEAAETDGEETAEEAGDSEKVEEDTGDAEESTADGAQEGESAGEADGDDAAAEKEQEAASEEL